jgi:hypothetical protein
MWVVIRNDELGASAVVHTDALEHHRARGWYRVSEPAADKDSLHPVEYDSAADLDAEPEKPKKTAAKSAKTETKEK